MNEPTPPVRPYDPNPAGYDDAIRAWIEYHDARKAGKVDPDRKLANQHIAFYDGAIIDHDTDYLALKRRVGQRPGIDPERLVIDFLAVHDGIPSFAHALP
jgi:hypothetical protein